MKALKGHTFEPRGVVVGHENIKMAASIVDAIIRAIGYYYLGQDDLVQVKTGPTRFDNPLEFRQISSRRTQTGPASALPEAGPDLALLRKVVSEASHTQEASHDTFVGSQERVFGQSCISCGGQNMIQAGSCQVCGDCGQTTGCS